MAMNGNERSGPFHGTSGLLTRVAGWIATALGAVHLAVAPWDARSVWSRVAEVGWWNTFTLERATTVTELQRSEAFWVSLGSFGAPMLILGCWLLWSARHHNRVPWWIGGILIAWGLSVVTVLPASPGWAIPVIGILVILGDRARGRGTAHASGPVARTALPR